MLCFHHSQALNVTEHFKVKDVYLGNLFFLGKLAVKLWLMKVFQCDFFRDKGENGVVMKREKITKVLQAKKCSWEIYLLNRGHK